MNEKKIRKIRADISNMLRSPQGRKSQDLIGVAMQLGRKLFDRGKEPTYIRTEGPRLMPPLSIPNHPGDMAVGTVRSILYQLLADCDEWEIYLQKSIKDNDHDE